MRGRRGLGIVVACGLSLTACAKQSPAPAPPPPPVAVATLREGPNSLSSSNAISATATVQSINRQTRMVTLRRSDGELIRFNVGDDVKNLPQVRKGDLVSVTYYESVALHLRKPGRGHMGVTVDEDATRAQPGELPAGAVGRKVKVTSKVVRVDRRNRSVTLELPSGEHITFAVEDPSQLRRLKVGDLVQATYREAIAVAVNKP
jgi:Cu/Ag efflux protein CusF